MQLSGTIKQKKSTTIAGMSQSWKSDNLRESNREKFNIAIAILELNQ